MYVVHDTSHVDGTHLGNRRIPNHTKRLVHDTSQVITFWIDCISIQVMLQRVQVTLYDDQMRTKPKHSSGFEFKYSLTC